MNITFNAYRRRDNSQMLYVNASNGVSVGISAERGFSPYGKGATQGQRNAMDAAWEAIRANGKVFTGDLTKHTETGFCAPLTLANGWVMVGTDVANIGGMDVGADGGYLIVQGLIVPLGQRLSTETEG